MLRPISLGFLLSVAHLVAQVDTGSISGLVTDKTGAVVTAAQVMVAQEDTRYTTVAPYAWKSP
jgi:hypothetical protein